MPDGSEQHRSPRYPIHLPFAYTVKAGVSPGVRGGWTRSLSEGGASVELAERFRLQTLLSLRLLTDRGIVAADARVIWLGKSAPAAGGLIHGLAFTQIAPEHLQTLRDLFHHLVVTRQGGLRLPLDLPVTCHPADPSGPPLQGRTGNVGRGGAPPPPPATPGTRYPARGHPASSQGPDPSGGGHRLGRAGRDVDTR
jgi:hypothetical protein